MPESPRFLIFSGREEVSKSVFSPLNELSPDDEDVNREFMMVKQALLEMASGDRATCMLLRKVNTAILTERFLRLLY